MKKTVSGFTIVELLIVIVVIAILAAISIVAYSGIQDNARKSAAQSAARQVAAKASAHMAEHEVCPADLAAMKVANSDSTSYQYTCDTSTSPAVFCVTAEVGNQQYYVDSAVQRRPTPGTCSTYNYLAWDKSNNASSPVPYATIDTSVFRTSTSSLRLGPNETGRGLRGAPFTGQSGQTYTLGLWIRTDANWNGTGNNSKIRFGQSSDGALLAACSYNGVKTTWTYFSCSYRLTGTNPSISISVGNDGSVGNIWLDDIILTRSY